MSVGTSSYILPYLCRIVGLFYLKVANGEDCLPYYTEKMFVKLCNGYLGSIGSGVLLGGFEGCVVYPVRLGVGLRTSPVSL